MRNRIALLGVLLICAAPAAAQTSALPPLLEPASAERHAGKIVWADLATPDLAAAKRFYAGLFGWTFRDVRLHKTDYAVALLGGRPVAGLFQRPVPSGDRRPAWLTFIAVGDVDAAAKTAREHGATVVHEPRTFAARGRQATFTDPEGAAFAVLASTSGDPGDYLAAPGDWIWSSLLAGDPGAEAAFYQTVIGYDVFDLPAEDGLEHEILSTDDYARASVNHFPKDSSRRRTHWINYLRVVDAADSAAKAKALGGRVLVEPHVDRHGGRIALVADPAGALVGLMEWSDADGRKEPK